MSPSVDELDKNGRFRRGTKFILNERGAEALNMLAERQDAKAEFKAGVELEYDALPPFGIPSEYIWLKLPSGEVGLFPRSEDIFEGTKTLLTPLK